MNSFWTSDKTRLEIDTLKAILLTKVNYEENCTEFYTMLQSEKNLLKKIHSSEKYKKFCTQKFDSFKKILIFIIPLNSICYV